jgi:hypothetical protein
MYVRMCVKYKTDRLSPTSEFYVGGHLIEFTDRWPHLGHIIDNNSDDQEDILQQRNKLCGQINNVLCFFNKRDPFVKLKLLLSYCFSFYGSALWDLSNPGIEKFYIFMLSRERVIRCVGRRMGVDVGARLSLVRELLLIRSGILSLSDVAFSNIDVDLMIDSLSRSA